MTYEKAIEFDEAMSRKYGIYSYQELSEHCSELARWCAAIKVVIKHGEISPTKTELNTLESLYRTFNECSWMFNDLVN